MSNPSVSIIILNWNGWKDTVECLESIFQVDYPDYNVVVVDNDSEDDSLSKIKDYCNGELKVKSAFYQYDPKNKPIHTLELGDDLNSKISEEFSGHPSNNRLVLIKNDDNYGFAEGNNIGMRFALEKLDTNFVLLLNNDTVVDPQFLKLMLNEAQNPDIGILGPNIYYYDDPERITYVGGNLNCRTGKITHPYLDEKRKGLQPSEMDYICGCSLLIKKSVIESVGLLDDKYFLYYEDTDWCMRARKKGIKTVHVPHAKIWHKIAPSNKNSKIELYYGIRNHYRLIRKNCSNHVMITFLPIFIARKLLFSLYLLSKGKTTEFKLVYSAMKDIFRGNYGFKDLK